MGAESPLESEFAHRINIKAATQDYILEPRIGKLLCRLLFDSRDCLSQSDPCFCCADYRTIQGVAGPLVIVQSVKVSLR